MTTISGKCICLKCGHGWVGEAPRSTVSLTCPECSLNAGVFCSLPVPDTAWECTCGCFHMFVSPKEIVCCLCGLVQVFP